MDRTSVTLPCPGSRGNFTVIVPTRGQAQYGIGHPMNTGGCTLWIAGLNENDSWITTQDDLRLDPGDSQTWYYPPNGAAKIVAICSDQCSGDVAVLEYDTPIC
jgi:hypothetical protein